MATLSVPISPADHIRGPQTAPVTLVEYGDFECPHCGQTYPIVEKLLERYGDKIRFVFRNFPLAAIHRHARQAAQATEAAALQGRFWEMHAILFPNQQALDTASLVHYAGQIGLDTTRFEADLESEVVRKAVQSQVEGGLRTGVNRTPTFFINGQRHDGDSGYHTLEQEILNAFNYTGL